jgi:hypothetical protein
MRWNQHGRCVGGEAVHIERDAANPVVVDVATDAADVAHNVMESTRSIWLRMPFRWALPKSSFAHQKASSAGREKERSKDCKEGRAAMRRMRWRAE